ncbi:MAG: hypothetical protein Q8K32_30955 [Archangium sp.]|nr:hypothetical protein [Archangium sp.]
MSKLPESGEVFALEVSKGIDVLFRVVAAVGKTRCVVLTRANSLTSPLLFEVQPHSHHSWNRPQLGGWVSEGPPAAVRWVGVVALRKGEAERVLHPALWVKLDTKTAELSRKVLPLVGWPLLVDDARAQWRWEHEREAVLAEDAKREREKTSVFEAAIAAQGKRRATMQKKGVSTLKRKRFFAAWKGAVPVAMIKEAEAAMQAAVLSLEGKSPAQAARRLSSLVRTFNKLDGKHGRSFDTIDREDIMDAVSTVAFACGVADDVFDEVIDAVRDF